jgi:Ca2+-binding RTX toxin-like protein
MGTTSMITRIYGNDGGDRIVGSWFDAPSYMEELYGDAGVDVLRGGNGDDALVGGADPDALHGGDGDDELWGGNGQDMLQGGPGDDILHGGAAIDTLCDQDGADTLLGGAATDIMQWRGTTLGQSDGGPDGAICNLNTNGPSIWAANCNYFPNVNAVCQPWEDE